MAQDTAATFTRAEAALRVLFPDKAYNIWSGARGDLNGDGIEEVAMVLTAPSESGPREERLAVLAGRADGQFTLLSLSGEYCQVRHFYNLDIARGSLFVQGVNSIDAHGVGSVTLQFRYAAALGDLQLIGRQDETESQLEAKRYTASTNYLTHTVIHVRQDGRRRREAKRVFAALVPRPLRGFECASLDDGMPPLYIREDMSIQQ